VTAVVRILCDVCGADSGLVGAIRTGGGPLRMREQLRLRGWAYSATRKPVHHRDICPQCRRPTDVPPDKTVRRANKGEPA
jgi:hypothetical protein